MQSFPLDSTLLKQIQNGNFDAVDVLVLKYTPLLRSIIRNEVNNVDAADDVYGDICLAIVRRFRRKGTADINAVDKWIKQVVRSKCQEYLRHEKKHRDITAVAQEQHAAALKQELCRELRRNEVSEVIDEMSPICRYVAELWLEGWTSAEIGEQLGIPEGTVKTRKRTIVNRLREHFNIHTA
ncbi:MAG: sigma-70 family RNA polymerase sigma factor [Candidatus Poribacteria bacterium]|nr:sigma-70 family RNA polymerase sigma factor [Candidatus Poribacteria bacterium]